MLFSRKGIWGKQSPFTYLQEPWFHHFSIFCYSSYCHSRANYAKRSVLSLITATIETGSSTDLGTLHWLCCFQVMVVCLVVLDAIFVLAELLIDLAIIKLEHGHLAPEVRGFCPLLSNFPVTDTTLCSDATSWCSSQIFHYLSLALLTFFMVELVGKLYAYRMEFFEHKFEVFDAVVVVISFVLDIVFIFHEDVSDGVGLLILLRLWRVARIING